MKLGEITTGGTFFKPAEYSHAAALLIEVTDFERQVPTNFGPKDTVTANITTFATPADVDNDNGTLNEGVKIQQVDLARKLQPLLGGGTVVRLELLPKSANLPNGAWVWRAVDQELRTKVAAYVERQEQGGAADANDVDDMPDYLK